MMEEEKTITIEQRRRLCLFLGSRLLDEAKDETFYNIALALTDKAFEVSLDVKGTQSIKLDSTDYVFVNGYNAMVDFVNENYKAYLTHIVRRYDMPQESGEG